MYVWGDIMALNSEMRGLINEMAESIRGFFGIKGVINDIDAVVEEMGGIVIEDVDIDGFSDGKIKKTGDNSFEITVSPFQSNERRNFTIAHELGHLFLHMGYITNQEMWEHQNKEVYYRNGTSMQEYQSNEFAAAFLMPRKEYKEVMLRYSDEQWVNTSKVAEHFRVSVDAAANRGKWLGYLRW